jgi:hypothetical protein
MKKGMAAGRAADLHRPGPWIGLPNLIDGVFIMSDTVGDFLLQRMSEWGVKRVYGNPGDGINEIIGAFGRSENGPGAIHLLSGLYDAQMDHAPVVAIVGQQTRAAIGGSYQQEMDLISPLEGVARTCFVGPRVFAAYRGRTADLEQVRATPLKSESRISDSGFRIPNPEPRIPNPGL